MPSTTMTTYVCGPITPMTASRMIVLRQCQQHLRRAADGALGEPTALRCEQCERNADREGHQHHQRGGEQRLRTGGEQSRQQVPAELVGAEQVCGRRQGQPVREVLVVDRVRPPERRGERQQQHDEQPERSEHTARAAERRGQTATTPGGGSRLRPSCDRVVGAELTGTVAVMRSSASGRGRRSRDRAAG